MPFDSTQQAAVIKVLGEKITQPCPACNLFRRQLMPEMYVFPAFAPVKNPLDAYSDYAGTLRSLAEFPTKKMPPPGYARPSEHAPPAMPCVSVICTNCGFTEFYNIHILGVADALKIPKPGVPLG